MKKISLLFFAFTMFMGASFAQSRKTTEWSEMNDFHKVFDQMYQYSKGDSKLCLLKENSMMIYSASKMLHESQIPANYAVKETRENLDYLLSKCAELDGQVSGRASNAKIKALLEEAKELVRKIEVDNNKSKK